ncbi:hypothetical protein [Microvirga pudoricolor]|uniref:hypothetical protein n=1 Tax=Microvirga pudoricolor TaxID=2778729 RepID=UPI00194EBEB4|nr:hypothetical protein [Microvirga pudoricolor]MBM6595462.1 hypothetical protein [Microvirga pudoricolor]
MTPQLSECDEEQATKDRPQDDLGGGLRKTLSVVNIVHQRFEKFVGRPKSESRKGAGKTVALSGLEGVAGVIPLEWQ